MEIVSIEAETFHKMSEALENIIQNLQKGKKTGNRQGLEEWLDNQDVCMLLNISPGKLLSLRRSGAIAYSRIDRKIYYKRKDIQSFMEQELKKQKTE
ncbi:helix-turn-helix domain-containing protein [Bacteroides thetaiotaomicron]|uniref:helix-turn-helix domain-containing protein n=1 Tax=Bacteroides thetaiotaomicron TaxID=818 RepID=UPI001F373FBE|nr:helix-turn-helix domain-containing protein [Bacteroides thetaiotaomicron]MCE8488501.1 helix-turn-helix domain-containing protein [Bacteroides thetaiotaomicron]